MRPSLTTDTLFLACTRPALWYGVPHEAAILNGMLICILFLLMHNPFYLLIAVAVHYAMRPLVAYDYNLFTVLGLWLNTKCRARNVAWWGGSSVSPLPLWRARKAREIRVYA